MTGGRNTYGRRAALLLAAAFAPAIALAALAVLVGALSAQPARSADALPDLGMARITDVSVANEDGRRLLRFSATIVNVGTAPFELRATRSEATAPFAVSQVLGGNEVATPEVGTVFGGDGHNHWHIRDLETYELDRLDNGVKVGTGAKSGFCFYDTTFYRTLPGTPQSRVYGSAGCGSPSSLGLTMGVSIGWGDTYPATLPDQFIDVTGLSSGQYRLTALADAANWFAESDETNNTTWVELSLTVNKGGKARVRVTGYGPAA